MISLPLLLIGPVRAGKTTLAHLISEHLQIPHVALDEARWEYYREIGYSDDLAKQIRKDGGFLALVFYRQLFDVHSVERVLYNYPNAVVDFGAGVGPYENQDHLNQVLELLAPMPNIFLILPSPDPEETLRVLAQRDANPPADLTFDINRHFVSHPGYRLLAKHVIYNQNQTPAQTCRDILALLK